MLAHFYSFDVISYVQKTCLFSLWIWSVVFISTPYQPLAKVLLRWTVSIKHWLELRLKSEQLVRQHLLCMSQVCSPDSPSCPNMPNLILCMWFHFPQQQQMHDSNYFLMTGCKLTRKGRQKLVLSTDFPHLIWIVCMRSCPLPYWPADFLPRNRDGRQALSLPLLSA